MIISVETPVFKGRWLRRTIDSVLRQSCDDWEYSLAWDGGDEESRLILEELERENNPRVHVYFNENRGIAHTRRFLTERSHGDYLLPLDDDDRLPPHAIERFRDYVTRRPWSGIVRARRGFIDEEGNDVHQNPWFPFERRHFQRGMVKDVFNHSQPYLIQRAAFLKTAGWEGFKEFLWAGADCDIFLKIEEVAPIELLDEVLYLYRINPDRASLVLTDAAAFEMWRRLADKTIARLGLPLERTNEHQPFSYRSLPQPQPAVQDVDFVLHFHDDADVRQKAEARLHELGVARDAIHHCGDGETVDGSASSGCRPLVCLLTAGTEFSRDSLESLLSTMHQQQADMAGPRILSPSGTVRSAKPSFNAACLPVISDENQPATDLQRQDVRAGWLPTSLLLARREVLRSSIGWNQIWQDSRLQAAELCLRARSRDFKCIFAGTVDVVDHGPPTIAWSAKEADSFQQRWRDYADLFASLEVADLSAILSMGLPDA